MLLPGKESRLQTTTATMEEVVILQDHVTEPVQTWDGAVHDLVGKDRGTAEEVGGRKEITRVQLKNENSLKKSQVKQLPSHNEGTQAKRFLHTYERHIQLVVVRISITCTNLS
ncbi:hypothetical protein J6590_076152 [Homalodisca vitripennis]|nr:hypothetical protein J6590_076152 [Homalodisca vitripennis]